MDEIAAKISELLAGHVKSAARHIGLESRLDGLEIESLDLAIIALDIEDCFGIDFPYPPEEAADAFKTVACVVERVRSLVQAKRSRPRSPLTPPTPKRSKSLWVMAAARI